MDAIRAEADPNNKVLVTNSIYWEDGATELSSKPSKIEGGNIFFKLKLYSGYRHLGGQTLVKEEVLWCPIPAGHEYLTHRHCTGKNNEVKVTFKKK